MTHTTRAADHAYRVAIEERISDLVAWRRWYRARPDWASFADMRQRHDVELRALLKLARLARSVARKAEHDLGHDEHGEPRTCRYCRSEMTAASLLAVGRPSRVDPHGPTPQLATYQAEGR